MPALLPLYKTLSPDTYGGAVLLGVDGVCIIAHGSSTAEAIVNGIGVAREMVEHDVVARDPRRHRRQRLSPNRVAALHCRRRASTARRAVSGNGPDRSRRDLRDRP